ncbi:MAG: DinB family protein [Ginsengibacter sp.]
MVFDYDKSIQVLERTPKILKELLSGLSDDWVLHNEGGDTWSPYDVMGHLVHGERTDWMNRLEIILSDQGNKTFIPFDRFAQFKESEGKSILQLLDEFESLRKTNLDRISNMHLSANDFKRKGIHPAFGEVTMTQLLSTWTVHDLTHLGQVTRVMAKQYQSEIGPWIKYFRQLQSQAGANQ